VRSTRTRSTNWCNKLRALLFILISSFLSCVDDSKISKECKDICNSIMEDKITEIEESIDNYCLTQDELIDFLSNLDYTEVYDRVIEMREEECRNILEN